MSVRLDCLDLVDWRRPPCNCLTRSALGATTFRVSPLFDGSPTQDTATFCFSALMTIEENADGAEMTMSRSKDEDP